MSDGGDLFDRAYALAAEIREAEAAGRYVDLGGRIARFAAAEAQRQLDGLAGKLGLATPTERRGC